MPSNHSPSNIPNMNPLLRSPLLILTRAARSPLLVLYIICTLIAVARAVPIASSAPASTQHRYDPRQLYVRSESFSEDDPHTLATLEPRTGEVWYKKFRRPQRPKRPVSQLLVPVPGDQLPPDTTTTTPSSPFYPSVTDPRIHNSGWPLPNNIHDDHPADQLPPTTTSTTTTPKFGPSQVSTDPRIHNEGSPLPDNDGSRPSSSTLAHEEYIRWLEKHALEDGESDASSRPQSPVPTPGSPEAHKNGQQATKPTPEEMKNLGRGGKIFRLLPELTGHALPPSTSQSSRDHAHTHDATSSQTSPPGAKPPRPYTSDVESLLNLYNYPRPEGGHEQVPHGKTDSRTSQERPKTSKGRKVLSPKPGLYSLFPITSPLPSPSTPGVSVDSTGDGNLEEPQKRTHRREKIAQFFPERPISTAPSGSVGGNTGTRREANWI